MPDVLVGENDHVISIDSLSQWDEFVRAELEQWEKFQPIGQRSDLVRQFDNLTKQLRSLQSGRVRYSSDTDELRSSVDIYNSLIKKGTICHSSDAIFGHAAAIESLHGANVASAFLVATFIDDHVAFSSFTVYDLKGCALASEYSGVLSDGMERAVAKISEAGAAAALTIEKAKKADQENDLLFEKRYATVLKMIRRADEKVRTTFNERLAVIQEERNAASEELSALTSQYAEYMALEAPVSYWNKKAKRHQRSSYIYGTICVAYAAVVLWLLIGLGENLFAPYFSVIDATNISVEGLPVLESEVGEAKDSSLPTQDPALARAV